MARIIGAIATSHTPTIGFAKDRRLDNDPIWKPIFDAYAPIRAWLAEKRADVLLTIYNDHITSFLLRSLFRLRHGRGRDVFAGG